MNAELISKKRDSNGRYKFYVHYVDCNRRLDEWVTEEQLDMSTVRVPQKVRKQPQIIPSVVPNEAADISVIDIE